LKEAREKISELKDECGNSVNQIPKPKEHRGVGS